MLSKFELTGKLLKHWKGLTIHLDAAIDSFYSGLFSRAYSYTLRAGAVYFILTLASGCINFYKINTVNPIHNLDTLTALQNSHKNFIIHFKDTSLQLMRLSINKENITGNLTPANIIQVKYLHPKSTQKNRYLRADQHEVLNEVHLYAINASVADTGSFSLLDTAISKVDINQKNAEATTNSHIIGGLIIVGLMAAVVAVLGAVALSNWNF